MNGHEKSGGFALITGLLFLIVLTILGVSSMSTVGLQERMASNLKEKERASEAGEIATRGAELFLAEFPPVGVLDEIPVVSGSPGVNEVWAVGGPIAGSAATSPAAFANDANWFFDDPNRVGPIVFNAPPFDNDDLIGSGVNEDTRASEKYAARPQSYTEESDFMPYTLNPEDLATGSGRFYYRATGRGVGGNATAVSVVQSMYTRRFK